MVLLRPKWVAGHVLVVLLVGLFVAAGFWQLSRNREAHDKLDAERAAFAAPAPAATTANFADLVERGGRVTLTGTFDPQHQALLRNRSRHGKIGYDVLTPMTLDDGTVVVVDRGWVSFDRVSDGLGDAGVPRGTVVVRGVALKASPLRAGEEAKPEGGVTSLPRVDLSEIVPGRDDALDGYVQAQYQQPAPAADAPALPDPAKVTEVNHLSYALQWFSFAAIAIIGWPIVLRRALRRRAPREPSAPNVSPSTT
jgi:cytochrome oxidase assembly protein ShyY1